MWDTFRRYEEQRRQEQIAKEQELAEKRQLAAEQARQQQTLREWKRRAALHRQSVQQEIEQQSIKEKRRHAQESHATQLAQIGENLRIANQQQREAQQEAQKRMEEQQQAREKGSPIEAMLFTAWCEKYPEISLERQFQIGKYRVDFACVEVHLAIELDGHPTHHTRRDRTRDYQRQRQIEAMGWSFLRFTGTEVFNDVESCVQIAWERIQQGTARYGVEW